MDTAQQTTTMDSPSGIAGGVVIPYSVLTHQVEGDWSLSRPSPEAATRVVTSVVGASVVRQPVGPALDSAADIWRKKLAKKMGEGPKDEQLNAQEWADLIWIIAAWIIGASGPEDSLRFRLYMHLRFVLGYEPDATNYILADIE